MLSLEKVCVFRIYSFEKVFTSVFQSKPFVHNSLLFITSKSGCLYYIIGNFLDDFWCVFAHLPTHFNVNYRLRYAGIM